MRWGAEDVVLVLSPRDEVGTEDREQSRQLSMVDRRGAAAVRQADAPPR